MKAAILAASVSSVSSVTVANLRGVAPDKNTSVEVPPPPRGHFYYAKRCEDCVYKGPGCGCRPAVEYFACLTMHCHGAQGAQFAEKCTALSDKCFNDIDIACQGPDTSCRSKFNQLPATPKAAAPKAAASVEAPPSVPQKVIASGALGFSLDIVNDNAYCGPFGKCLGKIDFKVFLHRPQELPALPAAPSPAAAASPVAAMAASPAAVPKKEEKKDKVWLRCGLPKGEQAGMNIEDSKNWFVCQKEIKGDAETCEFPMFDGLKAGQHWKAYCLLTDGENGKPVTQPEWRKIINVHTAAKDSAPAKKDETKPSKAEEVSKKAEAKPEAPEKVEAKPEKAEIKTEKAEVKDAEPEGPRIMANERVKAKLPWMVEKEKRAAEAKAKAAADKKAAKAEEAEKSQSKEAKEESQEQKAAPKEDAKAEKHPSGLPWMHGQAPPPPTPHSGVLSM